MSSSIVPRASRKYDVVLWGATGFTGKLTAKYLAGETGRRTNSGRAHPLVWAIGGRDAKKLEAIRALEVDEKIAEIPDIILGDSNDSDSLEKMTSQTRAIIATVGPFSLYGEPLIAACCATGTDYVDITGETIWVRPMIEKYSAAAEKSGALIVNFCGFDSVPADIGAYLAASELKKSGTDVTEIQGFVTVRGGGLSGGTIASMLNTLSLPKEVQATRRNPYLLNPDQPEKIRTKEVDQKLPVYNELIGKWTAPWLMAMINTRVARRSLSLRQKLGGAKASFGSQATYNECMPTSSAFKAFGVWFGLLAFSLLLAFKPTRYLLKTFVLPSPGQGPSEAARAKTTFTQRVVAVGENGKKVQSFIRGGDPGYTDTAKFVGEAGLMLAQDRENLKEFHSLVSNANIKKGANGFIGGFYTPSIVGGQVYVERLKGAGLKVEVEEFKP